MLAARMLPIWSAMGQYVPLSCSVTVGGGGGPTAASRLAYFMASTTGTGCEKFSSIQDPTAVWDGCCRTSVQTDPPRHRVGAMVCPSLFPSTTMLAVLPVTLQSMQSRGVYAPPPSEISIAPAQPLVVGLWTRTPSNVA